MSDSDLEGLLEKIGSLQIARNRNIGVMDANQITALVQAAVKGALQQQQESFEHKLTRLTEQIATLTTVKKPHTYEPVKIIAGIKCEEPLDLVKSLPEFDGQVSTYVSWRQAAHTAYEVFRSHQGSSRHYQAVGIIRNKLKGSADAILASFNTVLNFEAIIARLDFTYSDKRPIYLIEQELSTLRQGNLSVLKYFDEVEKKLTLLTNKTIMTHEGPIAESICTKYRADALRVFISGLKRPLCDILFASRPDDLPGALALAQEVEANRERYVFATNFAASAEDPNRFKKIGDNNLEQRLRTPQKNPHFFNRQPKRNGNENDQQDQLVPMEIDPSESRFRHNSNWRQSQKVNQQVYRNNSKQSPNSNQQQQFGKRQAESGRNTGPKIQRINNLSQGNQDTAYNQEAEEEIENLEEEELNFLGGSPCFRGSNEE